MDKINFGYSTKNIPISSNKEYLTGFIEMTENVIKHMRWKAFFFLNPNTNTCNTDTYGFNSRKPPPTIIELGEFENEMEHLIKSIKFRHLQLDQVQLKLINDANKIKRSTGINVSADKASNFYQVPPKDYQSALHKCIIKDYRKTNQNSLDNINKPMEEHTRSITLV